MLFVLLLATFFADEQRLSINEVGGRMLLAASVSQEFALIQLASEAMPPRIDLLHYDFRRQSFRALDDGRFPSLRPYHILPHAAGFLLVEKFAGANSKLHLLDFNGNFQKTLFLSNFNGVQPTTNIEQITPYRGDQYWVTLSPRTTEHGAVPAMLDLAQVTLERIPTATRAPAGAWWLAFQGSVYQVAPYTGEVTLTDSFDLRHPTLLAKGVAPRAVVTQPNAAPGNRHTSDFLRYHPVLQTPIFSGRGLILKRTQWLEGTKQVTFMGHTKTVPNRSTDYIVLAGTELRPQPRLTLEFPGFAALEFDQEQGVFSLSPSHPHE